MRRSRGMRMESGHPRCGTLRSAHRVAGGQRRRMIVAASSSKGDNHSSGKALAVEFSSLLNAQGLLQSHQRPSPMIPPTTVVETVMTALQRNDYPEEDEGVQVAYLFSKPQGCEGLLVGQEAQLLFSKPYDVLLGCHEWKAASALRFPSKRFAHKAIQAVQVQHGVTSSREHVFTFCLERCDLGPYKGCWLVVGVRQGNYAKGM